MSAGTPSLEGIERAAEHVRAELERVLGRARDAERVLDDVDCELETFSPVRARAARELRGIARMLTIAQCDLVHPDDERHGASVQVRDYAVEAERGDGPWRPVNRRSAVAA